MKPPTFIECTVCGREFGSKSIAIHERQCLQKLRRTEICQDGNSIVQGKGKNKKSVPSLSPVPRTTVLERQDRPPPWEQSSQILLPRIQTDYGEKSRKNQELIRPTTATLSKPKFLNPEYIRHDMTLMRIDYSASQLRINDDENHNLLRYNRHNIVLPSVNPTKGNKSKHQSSHKSDLTTKVRGVVKLPESTKMSLPSESKKQNGTETSSVGVVLPINSEIRVPDPFCPVKKSQSFPLLYSSDFVLKKMKANEIPFPQIPNHRIPNQSTPNYNLTPASRLPRWDDAEGCDVPGQNQHPGSFFPYSKYCPDAEAEVPATATEDLEFVHEGHEPSAPEVIFIRKDMKSFDTHSEESFGTSQTNSSYERLTPSVISFTNLHLNASKEVTEITRKMGKGTYELNGQVQIKDLDQSENTSRMEKLSPPSEPARVNLTTALCDNTCEGEVVPGDWLFGHEARNPSLETSVKHRPSSDENPPEYFQSPWGNGTLSGSECDNEGTSSGYGILRTPTNRTTLNNRKKRQNRKSAAAFREGFWTDPISYSTPLKSNTHCTKPLLDNLMTISHKKLANHDKKLRSRFSQLTCHDKVNDWLECCANVSPDCDMHGESSRRGLGDGHRTLEVAKHSANRKPPRDNEDPKPVKLSSAHEEKGDDHQPIYPYSTKTVSGMVTVKFQVKDGNETRTYNFVNKSTMEAKASSPVKRRANFTSTVLPMMVKTSDLFRCYAPPKCLRADKRVVKMLKQLESIVLVQRPKTSPSKALRNSFHLDCQKTLKRPRSTIAAAPNKVDSGKSTNSLFFQMKSRNQAKMATSSERTSHFPDIFHATGDVSPKSLVMTATSNPRPNPHPEEIHSAQTDPNAKFDPVMTKSGCKRHHLKPRPRPPTPRPHLSPTTQMSTLLWTRRNFPKLKVDKGSQAPETRSACVQFSTFAPHQSQVNRNYFGSWFPSECLL